MEQKAVALPSSREIPVASNPACSDPLAESMEKKSSCRFCWIPCNLAKSLSSPDPEHQPPPPIPVASKPSCSETPAESMEKKSSRRFSCIPCISAKPSSPPDAENQPQPQIPVASDTVCSDPLAESMVKKSSRECILAKPPPPPGAEQQSTSLIHPPISAVTPESPITVPQVRDNIVSQECSSPSPNTTNNNHQPGPSSSLSLAVTTVSSSTSNPSPIADDANPGEFPSASSSSGKVPTLSDSIREDAKMVKDNLDAFIKEIDERLKEKKLKRKKTLEETQNKSEQKEPNETQNKSKKTTHKLWSFTLVGFSKLSSIVLEGVNAVCSVKDVFSSDEVKKVGQDLLKGLGQAHWVGTGFLLVSYILDRVADLSSNGDDCWSVLEQMYGLAVDLRKLKAHENLVTTGTELITEGFLMCCNQIDRSNRSRFLSTSNDKIELVTFKEKLQIFQWRMTGQILTQLSNSFSTLLEIVRPPIKERERPYPYHAVGIEKPMEKVAKLLTSESQKKAVAVIVHGLGGLGKSTLADAVFARYYVEDCNYSFVSLNSSLKTVEYQKIILKDLKSGTEEGRTSWGPEDVNFGDFMDGRLKIDNLLREKVALIYIDNVVDRKDLEDLLLCRNLCKAKNLRLLITTRDASVRSVFREMTVREYKMEPLRSPEGIDVLTREIYGGTDYINGEITPSEVEKLVNLVGSIPKLLELAGAYIRSEPDKRRAYNTVMQGREKLTGNIFQYIPSGIFAYDLLPDQECKDAFLDICSFFKGWEWETVAHIVGLPALDVLEKRSIVSQDKKVVFIHDIILTVGQVQAKAEGTRYDYTKRTADDITDFFDKERRRFELIKGLWFADQECKIPATKLNSMDESLRIFGHKMMVEGQCGKTFENLRAYNGETPHFPFTWSRLTALRFLKYQPENLDLLRQIPTSNLKHIELEGSQCSVTEISSSDIQRLQHLEVLRLTNFKELKNLPGEWGDYLKKSLKELALSHCTSMKELTGSISQLTSLKLLKLDHCCNLRRLPKDRASLSSSFEELNLWKCLSLKALHSSFGEVLDSGSKRLFKHKGVLSDSPESESDSDYESDTD